MKKVHYFAAWTHSDFLCGCDHEHQTVMSAATCSFAACGGYAVAVETHLRELTEAEEAEFQFTQYGTGAEPKIKKTKKAPKGFLFWLSESDFF